VIIGRGTVQEAVGDVLTAVRDGHGRALVIAGQPGSGRTSLLDEVEVVATDLQTLRICGVAGEHDIAFSGLQELVGGLLPLLDDIPELQANAIRGAVALASAKGSDRLAIGAGLLSLLSAAAGERPVVCLVDDADLVDEASLDALTFAARRIRHDSVGVVFATDSKNELRFAMPLLRTVTLAPLDAASARAVLADRYPEMIDSVADEVIEAGGGVPGWLLDIAGQLSAEQRVGAEPLPVPLPPSGVVAASVRQQLSQLSEQAQGAALTAAAAGTQTMRVMTAADPAMVDGFREAERHGLLAIIGGRVRVSPGVASAIYHAATPAERRRASRLLADAMTGDPRYRDLRAHHLAASSDEPDAELAAQLEGSAEEARTRRGEAAAVLLFELSSRLSADVDLRDSRTVSAAESAWLAGQPWRAAQLIERVVPNSANPRTCARVAYLNACLDDQAGRLVERASDLASAGLSVVPGDVDVAVRVLCAAVRAAPTGAATPLAAALGDLDVPPGSGLDLLVQLAIRGDVDRRLDVEQATSALDGMDLGEVVALIATMDVRPTVVIDDVLTRVRAQIERRAVVWLPLAQRLAADRHLATGEWTAAALGYRGARELAEELGQSEVAWFSTAGEATVAALQGRDDLTNCLDRLSGPDAQHTNAERTRLADRAVRGLAELGRGRALQALALWADSTPAELCDVLPAGVLSAVDWVEATVRYAGRPAAAALLPSLAPTLDDPTEALWADTLVIDEGYDEGFAMVRRALGNCPIPNPYVLARVELQWGERLRRDGHRLAARDHLRSAHEMFQRFGAAGWDGLARQELKATGETPRHDGAAGLDELTPQERQVAEVIATGATYKEAAGQLYLSVKTIEFHLNKIYRKLGITSRRELAGRLAQVATSP
jgi:DNA-binding CsgD family transcriptional regulator